MEGPITFDPDKDAANLAKHGISPAMAEKLDLRRAIIRRLHVLAFTRREGACV